MNAERFQEVSPVFRRAIELSSEDRAAYLDAACAGDAALREDVGRLISAHEQAGSFIESPVYERAAALLTNQGTSPVVGQLIGHYTVVAPLGKGGMDSKLNAAKMVTDAGEVRLTATAGESGTAGSQSPRGWSMKASN